ncbi:hypothetical protein PQC39_gp069 [Vibrio phage Vp_R1]|uniref:Uncharacterized protein n=1 Tax=Vibrio phage Vp_R1 TaxID=2059867 RepID=A0A2H5BQ23_9CAUD|nr:hypothetical protein PQC39_gp069 [Vibrio phage Vp_R1]AUG88433.1 hypothetical protein VPR_069 [Vibrio phage Vp_R1]
MSYLKRDYEWYYSGSYLGLRVGGEVHPFYIEEVLWEGDTDEYGDIVTDGDEDETLSMMSFYGRVSDGENTEYKTVNVTDSSVVYELPHLGVFNVRGRDTWLRYMPQRSVKKGLSDNRIYPRVSLNMDLAYQIYSRGFTRTKHQFSFVGNVVYYKGQLVVGSISENTITLSENAMYLLPMLKKQVEEINGNSTTGVLTVSTQ